jgi:hypothetical protein
MTRTPGRLLLTLLTIVPPGAAADDWAACRDAIVVSEREADLPAGLLGAIARTESGRRNAATGRVEPWPWALNAAGIGQHAPGRAEAVATVAALQARGVRSIDVGCLQVNLLHHPGAFGSLEDAFEPLANARYAARFLRELRVRAGGDWSRAVAWYHSATPERGEAYRLRVKAAVGGDVAGMAAGSPAPLRPPGVQPVGTDRGAPLLAPMAWRILVFVPQSFAASRPAMPPPIQAVPYLRALPKVITPRSGS